MKKAEKLCRDPVCPVSPKKARRLKRKLRRARRRAEKADPEWAPEPVRGYTRGWSN